MGGIMGHFLAKSNTFSGFWDSMNKYNYANLLMASFFKIIQHLWIRSTPFLRGYATHKCMAKFMDLFDFDDSLIFSFRNLQYFVGTCCAISSRKNSHWISH